MSVQEVVFRIVGLNQVFLVLGVPQQWTWSLVRTIDVPTFACSCNGGGHAHVHSEVFERPPCAERRHLGAGTGDGGSEEHARRHGH